MRGKGEVSDYRSLSTTVKPSVYLALIPNIVIPNIPKHADRSVTKRTPFPDFACKIPCLL